jgi:hypothetical protein
MLCEIVSGCGFARCVNMRAGPSPRTLAISHAVIDPVLTNAVIAITVRTQRAASARTWYSDFMSYTVRRWIPERCPVLHALLRRLTRVMRALPRPIAGRAGFNLTVGAPEGRSELDRAACEHARVARSTSGALLSKVQPGGDVRA